MSELFSNWSLEFHSGIPAYRQIIQHVQNTVAAGLAQEGCQLPTIRALHRQLGINPNTVARAYRELQLLGLVSAEQGSGCYIAPQPSLPKSQEAGRQAKLELFARRIAEEARREDINLQDLACLLINAPASPPKPASP